MSNQMREIKATFTRESARWDKKTNKYVDHSQKVEERTITMEIFLRDDKPILKFHGGPTGFESYYVETLLRDTPARGSDTLCICAGTVNSYAVCTVPWKEVLDFIKDCGYEGADHV